MDDPRIRVGSDALLEAHLPGVNLSDIQPGIVERAGRDAETVIEALDFLRLKQGNFFERDIERLVAVARMRLLEDILDRLQDEMSKVSSDERYSHLEPGIRWALEILTDRVIGVAE
jgi:hypothetical protein